jgi:uncharacterized protein
MLLSVILLLACVPVLGLLVLLLGWISYRGMIHYRVQDEAHIRQAALDSGDFDASVLDLPWIEEDLASPGGYPLRVHALEPADSVAQRVAGQAPRIAVFHHGIGWGWLGMIRYMMIFREEGWTVVGYDSRGHGSSGKHSLGGEAPRPSYGYYEKDDLRAVVDWAVARLARGRPGALAVFGESMGAATVLQYAPLDDRLDAVIADCPYSSALGELEHRLRGSGVIPPFRGLAMRAADAICERLEGFSLREADPARAILETEVPILFVHGLEDRFVPWRMSVAMAESRRRRLPGAMTELYLVPGARHAQSIAADRPRYEARIREFLQAAIEGGGAG